MLLRGAERWLIGSAFVLLCIYTLLGFIAGVWQIFIRSEGLVKRLPQSSVAVMKEGRHIRQRELD